MEYIKPDYLKNLPEEFKEYFNEELFKDLPYPPTIQDANDFLLFNVFKVNEKDIITMFETDKNGKLTGKSKDFTKGNYDKLFNYNYWKYLSNGTKIVLLYWFYEDVCKELEIFTPRFCFLNNLPENFSGYYDPKNNKFVFNLQGEEIDEENPESAYSYLEIIAHELKHAQFWTQKHDNYYKKFNSKHYSPLPSEKDYDLSDDYQRFCYTYDMVFYHMQPTELESYNYGITKAKSVFTKNNTKKIDGKLVLKDKASLIDLRFFRSQAYARRENKIFFKYVMGDDFKQALDDFYLAEEMMNEVEKIVSQLQAIDPTLEIQESGELFYDTKLEKDEDFQKLLKSYCVEFQGLAEIECHIENNRQKLYKQYKQKLLEEQVELYEDEF